MTDKKPMRFCPGCRRNKVNKGFKAARRKDGRITGYRCGECQKGLPGKSPYFLRPSQSDMAKDKKHYDPRFKLGHFQDEINDRE